ncbi:MAG TPA: hypothetical protein VNA66_11485 [Gammaproteobacteria bacterium]|jgi:hypothetical protein|nr:hypothetical protein [Gammaproteobacteria bacterium]
MFSMRFWDSFGSPGVSCVKLPAAVAFPTDGRLLQRIEESRRALPATNNMKPLWKSRELAPAPGAPSAPRSTSPQPLRIVDVTLEAESLSMRPDRYTCVVPLARVAGSMARARDGISVSAARS